MTRDELRVGDTRYVAINSWAGLSLHLVLIEKVCAVRVKVCWCDAPAFGRVQGQCYYVPPSALRRSRSLFDWEPMK